MSQSKNWCFTLNNYTDDHVLVINTLVEEYGEIEYIIYGKEVGEENNTPHLQGFISFNTRRRMGQVRNVIPGNPHVEPARNVAAAISYCKKDGNYVEFGSRPSPPGTRSDLESFKDDVKAGNLDLSVIREIHSEVYAKYTRFCLEYITDHFPKKVLVEHALRPWQENLRLKLDGEPNDREIVFLVDETGNSGKTWFSHWYTSKNPLCQVMLPGRKADMAFALDVTIRVLFVDAPRSKQGEFLQYDFLEDVKNGYVFSTKYESRVKTLSKVHCVVNMNEHPDYTKLSNDRFTVIEL